MNAPSLKDLTSAEAILRHYTAFHLAARQENAQNLARALGMVASPYATQSSNKGAQLGLDLFPHRIKEKEWEKIEAGLIQTTRTLQALLQDIYSQGEIFKQPGFPYESILGHPDYQRECRSFPPREQLHLRFIAIDLVQKTQGNWAITALHLASPQGIAYALQNRRIQSQVFPELMEKTHILPISHFPTQLLENLQSTASTAQNRFALLSDANTRHLEFEHGFLARKMGIVLAQPQDLIVRDKVLHYKTVSGLQPIHTLLKFTTQSYLDPILSGKSTGIPGLFHSWRGGFTELINPLGSAVAESRLLFPWLSQMTHFYLKESNLLETQPTYFSSDPTHANQIKKNPENFNCFYLTPIFRPIKNPVLALENLHKPFVAYPKMALATLPCLNAQGSPIQKPFSLRCFILIDKNTISVVPGGLTRINKEEKNVSNGSYLAKDTWVIGSNSTAPLRISSSPSSSLLTQALGSRTAELLYWMGRYCERAECTARMFSILDEVRLESVRTHNPLWQPLWNVISQSGGYNRQIFQKTLQLNSAKIAYHITFDTENSASLLSSVYRAQQNANDLQDYISPEAWTVINRLEQTLSAYAKQSITFGASAMIPIRRGLETALNQLASFRGMILRTMLQDTGNGFFYIGLYVERILMTTASLQAIHEPNLNVTHSTHEEDEIENPLFNAFLRMMGIQDAYHRKYQSRVQSLRVDEILLKEKQSPASFLFCAQRLSDFFTRQIGHFPSGQKIAAELLQQLTEYDVQDSKKLLPLLTDISHQASHLHELISDTFFQHQTSGETQTFITSPSS